MSKATRSRVKSGLGTETTSSSDMGSPVPHLFQKATFFCKYRRQESDFSTECSEVRFPVQETRHFPAYRDQFTSRATCVHDSRTHEVGIIPRST